jgi:hypothetical protein
MANIPEPKIATDAKTTANSRMSSFLESASYWTGVAAVFLTGFAAFAGVAGERSEGSEARCMGQSAPVTCKRVSSHRSFCHCGVERETAMIGKEVRGGADVDHNDE